MTEINIQKVFMNTESLKHFCHEIMELGTLYAIPEEVLPIWSELFFFKLFELLYQYADEIEKMQEIRENLTEEQIKDTERMLKYICMIPKRVVEDTHEKNV